MSAYCIGVGVALAVLYIAAGVMLAAASRRARDD